MSALGTPLLHGREKERAALDRLLGDVRSGQSRALVLRGEPGIGKTALLEDLCERAEGVQLVRGGGVESEAELAFAGLHHMCSQMIEEKIELLPDPQHEAIRIAFGQSAGPPPDAFLLGLAVLNRLADVAEDQPVLCVVDDAQWLDHASAQTLAFVARRLQAESVGVVFAIRDPIEQLTGLPELLLRGLAPDDARGLLDSVMSVPLDQPVRERFIAEAHGNPLALLELPRAPPAGGFGVPDPSAVSGRVEDAFQRRAEELPSATQLLLVTAAAEPLGDPVLLWRATSLLGIAPEAVAPAEEAGLLTVGARVVFRHPLVRSAVYRSASLQERRRVHSALGDATDAGVDPDRHAWHRAQSAAGADEGVAAELERSAERAQARGGLAAAAAFLARAVELTPAPGLRGQRAFAAARAKLGAGSPAEASVLLSIAEGVPLDELGRARADLLAAQLAFAVNRGSDAPPLLLKAAKRFAALDPRLARDTYLEALTAAVHAGPLARGGGVREAAEAVRSAPPPPQPAGAYDELLDGVALVVTDGVAAGFPLVKRALVSFRSEESLRGLFQACHAANAVWDFESLDVISRRQVELARDAGALTALVMALVERSGAYLARGDLASAATVVAEAQAVSAATGIRLPSYGAVSLAARRGREAEAFEVFETSLEAVRARGEGIGVTHIQWATAMLNNALGRYDRALEASVAASARPLEFGFGNWGLLELIESAARTGNCDRAVGALEELCALTRASGTDWALGNEARARALVAEGPAAEALYRDAIDYLVRTPVRFELARGHLLYGEWLRREGRRVDAREQLRTAHQMFESFGAEAFAARAARELAATGERVRRMTLTTAAELTPQEAQIARLAAKGHSNREIGGQLFISHRTVGYHLGKVFAKLDVTNRAQLHAALDGDASPSTDVRGDPTR